MTAKKMDARTLDFFKTLDLVVTPIMLTDGTYRHLFRNSAFQEQIGYSFDEVYNRETWYEHAFPDINYRSEAMRLWDEQLANKTAAQPVKLPVRVRCKNDVYRWYEIYEYEINNYKVVTFIDIDEIQKKNQDLLKTIKFNNLLNASIAHDIRSPLATLKLLLHFNDNMLHVSDPKLKHWMERVNNQIGRIFDILDSSIIHRSDELNHFLFTKQAILLRPFIEKVQSYYEEEMSVQHQKWNTQLMGHETVFYDLFILEVMLRNILSNAVKHTPPHQEISIAVEETAFHTDIIIQDTGGGIAPEAIALIMQPLAYHRHAERQDIQMGLGVGLLLSKEILESHWGKLIIESHPPVGSTFRIRIPTYIPEFDNNTKNNPERNE